MGSGDRMIRDRRETLPGPRRPAPPTTGLFPILLIGLLGYCTAGSAATAEQAAPDCPVALALLGTAQDAGRPQIGHHDDPAWADASLRRSATALALIDQREAGRAPRRWLFEATPDITEQLHALDRIAPSPAPVALDGIFLTHAHIGHYAGLMLLGHEAAGATGIPVYAMPRMANYLENNGPWSQLVRYGNIDLRILADGHPTPIARDVVVTPILVPHRQEFSEVVGFTISGPSRSVLFIPDIDRWTDWDEMGVRVEALIAGVDRAYLDGTFFSGDELPGRDMSKIPHPPVAASMARFAALDAGERSKIHFIHFNHTNPLLNPDAPEREAVAEAGMRVAEEGDRFCL